MSDELEKSLRALKGERPSPRLLEGREAKEALIIAIGGPRTAESIRKAMQSLPVERIPFLFSTLDPQLVIDVMANDLDALIREMKARKRV